MRGLALKQNDRADASMRVSSAREARAMNSRAHGLRFLRSALTAALMELCDAKASGCTPFSAVRAEPGACARPISMVGRRSPSSRSRPAGASSMSRDTDEVKPNITTVRSAISSTEYPWPNMRRYGLTRRFASRRRSLSSWPIDLAIVESSTAYCRNAWTNRDAMSRDLIETAGEVGRRFVQHVRRRAHSRHCTRVEGQSA